MARENDLEGQQDMGGKHGGQAGMPKPEDRSSAQQGIVRASGDRNSQRTKRVLNTSAGKIGAMIRLAIRSSDSLFDDAISSRCAIY